MAVRPWLSYGKLKQQWRTLVWYCWICSGFDKKNFCGNHLQLLPCVLFIACDRTRQCFNSATHWIKRNLSIAHLILAHEEHVRRQQQPTLWMLCILRRVGFCQCVWRVGVHRRVRTEALSFVNLFILNVLRCIILWSHYADAKLMEVWKWILLFLKNCLSEIHMDTLFYLCTLVLWTFRDLQYLICEYVRMFLL